MKNPIDGWTNVLSFERNEVVFENRNRAYGAYQIRIEYSRTLLIALLGTVCGFLFLAILIPALTEGLQPTLKNLKLTEFEQIFDLHPPGGPLVETPKQRPSKSTIPPRQQATPAITPAPTSTPTDQYHPIVTDHPLSPEPIAAPADPASAANPSGNSGPFQNGPAGPIGTGPGSGLTPMDEAILDPGTPPQYVGGETAMYTYLTSNIQFPERYREMGISGKAYISFVVEKDGSISNVKAERE
jgi:protein TonB